MVAPVLAAFLPADVTAVVVALNGGNAELDWLTVGLTLCIAVKLTWRFSQTRLRLDSAGATAYGLLLRSRRASMQRVASALLLAVYDDRSLLPIRQLFLLDAAGSTLLRMRGRYWSDEQMRVVTSHFDIPVSEAAEPVTSRDLRAQRGGQLTWFERHPVTSGIVLVVAGLTASAAIALVATFVVR
jgi:hypothetical protein